MHQVVDGSVRSRQTPCLLVTERQTDDICHAVLPLRLLTRVTRFYWLYTHRHFSDHSRSIIYYEQSFYRQLFDLGYSPLECSWCDFLTCSFCSLCFYDGCRKTNAPGTIVCIYKIAMQCILPNNTLQWLQNNLVALM